MQEIEFMVNVSKDIKIQSSLYRETNQKSDSILCIITHPYSLWGGSMHNNVVIGVRNQLVKGGYHCIAFNFRGVGKSTGIMGDGIGEQEDLIAVCNHSRDKLHYFRIVIVGYSYGGLIGLSAAKNLGKLEGMVLISYPSGFVKHLLPDFTVKFPLLFVHGKGDDLIPVSRVQELLPKFHSNTKLEIINTDHFYNGQENRVGTIIRKFCGMIENNRI
jgi:alpha/beta superfamily hydrolase